MSWERIRGQEAARVQVAQAWKSGRLGHAYALIGPAGVGKRLFAREWAKAMLCERRGPELTACDHCSACRQVEAETHPDLHWLRTPEGKHALPVEEMRQFCEALARKPLRGGRVVGILEDADDLNVESANAFLKTLEEPPGAALILLLCSGWEQLLPTIRSRCQQIRLAPLNRTDIHAILTEHGITDPALQEEAWRWCRGSAARALALVEGGLPQLRQTLWEGLASGTIAVDRWTQQCIEYAEAAGKDSASQRERAELLLDLLVEALRQMLRQQVGASLAVADWSVSLTSVATLTPERLLDWLDRTLLAYTHLERRVPLPLLFEALFDYLARSLEQDTQPASAPT